MRVVPIVAVSLSALAAPLPAQAAAARFDAELGQVTVEGASIALDFEDAAAVEATGIYGYNLFTNAGFDTAALAARVHREEGLCVEGRGCLGLAGDVHYTTLPIATTIPAWAELTGRRVEVRLWQKPDGTRVTPSITWYAGLDTDNPTFLGSVTFQPTGDVTSDGWEEWTSGPVDLAWGDVVIPTTIDFMDQQIMAAYGGASPDDQARAYVDAFTVEDLGPALVAAQPCTVATEEATCGVEGACHLGRCVDAAIRLGQPILDDALRADYVDRRIFEIDTFEGGRVPQERVDIVRGILEPLKEQATASTFWPLLAEAYDSLIDGHASGPLVSYPSFQNAGVCVHDGEADLLPGAPVVPLVFQTSDNEIGALLEPGDALVEIDGLPTAEWVEAAWRLIGHPGDPEGASVVTAPSIFMAALDTGATVTFQRCAQAPAGGGACDAADIETIELDLATLVGDRLIDGLLALGYEDVAECDYRFIRPVPSTGTLRNTAYEFAGHVDEAGVRTLVINGVPSYYGEGGEEWFADVQAATESGPELMILDERTGNGGGVDAMDWVAASFLDPADLYAMDFMPFTEEDELSNARGAVASCSSSNNGGFGCGNGFRWFVGDVAREGGLHGAASGTKLAVLIASDVSGNDYVTKMLNRRSGETRVFGAGATWGAFGVIWSMAGHMGELAGGSLQVQDTIFMSTANDGNEDWSTSTGERPDEVVRQKQSDAILGRDTVLEAAKAWLQSDGGAP